MHGEATQDDVALGQALEGSGLPGLAELRQALRAWCGGPAVPAHLLEQQPLARRVYRLLLAVGGEARSLILKCLTPVRARCNQRVVERWLPALGLGHVPPALLGSVAARNGEAVWHLLEDLGDWPLDTATPDARRVGAAVELIAQLHTRAAGHPLLAEWRREGCDLGMGFYASNVADAIRGLEALEAARYAATSRWRALRSRMLERLYRLREEEDGRARLMAALGGPETLLHGDLWNTNVLVRPAGDGLQARLIDWENVGAGPACYDVSRLLFRFRQQDRPWILERYREAVARAGWSLPPARELNVLFETAEYARYAERTVWPALALLQEHAEWGYPELAEIEQWFEAYRPALSLAPDDVGALRA